MSLRVALTHAFCWPEVRRGGERYLHELAAALARRGHRVTIFAGARSAGIGREEGVRLVRLPRSQGRSPVHTEGRFARRVVVPLALGSFDVVHSLGPQDALASIRVRRVRRRRTVYTCLGIPRREWWERRPDGGAHARVVEAIDVYGCLSRYAQHCLLEGFGREGALTPGGVRLDVFRPVAERTSAPTLLYSGALDERRKGVGTLLDAVALLAREEPGVRLWLSGPGNPGPLLADAPAAARDRTEVLPVGGLSDQPGRYSAAWATVLPASNEAFGLALVESLACGTPIVAGADAALPELVEQGIGTQAPPGNAAALAQACVEALVMARDTRTRDRCREAARRHGWDEAVAPAIEALYLSSERDDR